MYDESLIAMYQSKYVHDSGGPVSLKPTKFNVQKSVSHASKLYFERMFYLSLSVWFTTVPV
jgi:hypothetical protein